MGASPPPLKLRGGCRNRGAWPGWFAPAWFEPCGGVRPEEARAIWLGGRRDRRSAEGGFHNVNASVTHCAFFSSGVLDESSLAGFYLDTQAAAASAADVHGGQFAALDLMQNGLPGDAEDGGGLP